MNAPTKTQPIDVSAATAIVREARRAALAAFERLPERHRRPAVLERLIRLEYRRLERRAA